MTKQSPGPTDDPDSTGDEEALFNSLINSYAEKLTDDDSAFEVLRLSVGVLLGDSEAETPESPQELLRHRIKLILALLEGDVENSPQLMMSLLGVSDSELTELRRVDGLGEKVEVNLDVLSDEIRNRAATFYEAVLYRPLH